LLKLTLQAASSDDFDQVVSLTYWKVLASQVLENSSPMSTKARATVVSTNKLRTGSA